MVTVRRFTSDGTPITLYDVNDPSPTALAQSVNVGNPGDIRINFGNLWSVKLHGDGSPASFEKKISKSANGGLNWERLHTFTETPSDGIWRIAMGVVAGRLFVNVVGTDIPDTAYVYTEQVNSYSAALKDLTIPAAPLTVTGICGGGGVTVGLRRIGYTEGQFTDAMTISDAVVTGTLGSPPIAGSLTAIRYSPVPNGDVFLTSQMISATRLQYTATLTATSDGREPACCKWVFYDSERAAATGTP
jgi:hypothetical protein